MLPSDKKSTSLADCSICMEDVQNQHDNYIVNNANNEICYCKHSNICKACWIKILSYYSGTYTCPICKKDVTSWCQSQWGDIIHELYMANKNRIIQHFLKRKSIYIEQVVQRNRNSLPSMSCKVSSNVLGQCVKDDFFTGRNRKSSFTIIYEDY